MIKVVDDFIHSFFFGSHVEPSDFVVELSVEPSEISVVELGVEPIFSEILQNLAVILRKSKKF